MAVLFINLTHKNMTKVIKVNLLAGLMLAIGFIGLTLEPVKAEGDATAGSIIKGEGLSTLYYLGEDGKRYVFPNSKTYFSWFADFSEVVEVPLEDLYNYPLGGNVRYKPGSLLLKIKTDLKVYAVGENGKLHWVKDEGIAQSLYGANWNLLIDDVPDSFFTNYQVDVPVETADGYDPEEEEEEIPTISYNLGFKARLVSNIQESAQERRCLRLGKFITRTQERLSRLGIAVDELGADYFAECFNDDDDNDNNTNIKSRWRWHKAGKITICHIPAGNMDNAHTIVVSANAAKAHLAQGDTLGACTGEEPASDDDETAPVISGIEVAVSEGGAIITWTTDEDADSEVEYSESTPVDAGTIINDETADTAHSLEITGLSASTTYYYKVKSTDESGNQAISEEASFITSEETLEPDTIAPVISLIEAVAEGTTATITWTTDEDADSKVSFALETISSTTVVTEVIDGVMDTAHSLELTGLATSTEYFFIVESKDVADNVATSSEDTFETLAE